MWTRSISLVEKQESTWEGDKTVPLLDVEMLGQKGSFAYADEPSWLWDDERVA